MVYTKRWLELRIISCIFNLYACSNLHIGTHLAWLYSKVNAPLSDHSATPADAIPHLALITFIFVEVYGTLDVPPAFSLKTLTLPPNSIFTY